MKAWKNSKGTDTGAWIAQRYFLFSIVLTRRVDNLDLDSCSPRLSNKKPLIYKSKKSANQPDSVLQANCSRRNKQTKIASYRCLPAHECAKPIVRLAHFPAEPFTIPEAKNLTNGVSEPQTNRQSTDF